MATPADTLRSLYSGYVSTLQGVSDWLRDDLPAASPGLSKWAQETGRRACRKYARQRGSVPFLTNDPTWDGMCSGYLGAINEGAISGGSYGPPFTGGQCSGVNYFLRTNRTNWDTNGNFLSQVTLDFSAGPGPVSFVALPAVDQGPGGSISTGNARFYFSNGSFVTSGFTKVVWRPTNVTTQILTRQIIRVGGQPDNCGDPPSQYQPPVFPSLPSLPAPTNPAPGLGNNWDVGLLPDGRFNICIGGECSTGIPPAGGGGPDSGSGPGEPDGDPQETDPNDPNDPNEVSGCVEEDNILTGLQIEITQAPQNYQGLGNIYYRSCWIWMGPNSDLLDMVSDGKAIENGQFVIPDSNDCTCYKVRANPGFRVSVQAYSRPKEE